MKIHAPDFDLHATLDSGQVFGFVRHDDGTYEGPVRGARARIAQDASGITIETVEGRLRETDIRSYFDLDRNLKTVYALIQKEPALRSLLPRLAGLRIIRQDAWEALACFILSSNNNVKRIQLLWRRLTSALKTGPEFPGPQQIASRDEATYRKLGLGYRGPYLLGSARLVSARPHQMDELRAATYEEAFDRLLEFPGIGPKVADCVLLHGFQKYEAFPVDVWVYRAMKKHFFRKRKVRPGDFQRFARRRWGNHAGYVQQYLYYGAKIGILI